MVYFFSYNEMDAINQLMPECDIMHLSRVRWMHFLDVTVHNAKALEKIVLFDLDDLVFDLKYIPLLNNSVAISISSYKKMRKKL